MAKKKRDWIYLTPYNQKPVTLTAKQQIVFDYIKSGYRAKEIAFEMGCSKATIRKHETAIRTKLDARTNAHAVTLMIGKL